MAAMASGVSFSDGFLRNLSTRGQVGTGSNILIAGFVVGGSTPKQVLVRAIGPGLAALGVSGCSANHDDVAAPQSAASTAMSPAVRQAPALPPPQALAEVVSRLADTAVPGGEKLALIEDGAPADAETLDRFAAALRDGGYAPVTVSATDVHWSPTAPDEAVAIITVTPPEQRPGVFAFPLAFRTGPAGWQLTRGTAETLLAFPPGQ